jgi:hypothetical protein
MIVFPPVSQFIFLKTAFQADIYYSIAAITIVSVIPMLIGMAYSFVLLDENNMHILKVIAVSPTGKKNFLYMLMIIPVFFSFTLVLLSIIVTDPVPDEGWLRSFYVSFLLSLQASYVFPFNGGHAGNKMEGLALSTLYGVFLVAVPFGLLLHHPWNYFAFFSPLYWISWAWVVSSPSESLIYGSISIIITFGFILLFFRHFLKRYTN